MSTMARLTGADFDAMVARGAFDVIGPKKVELLHGELRFLNPAGPIHDDHIEFLTNWSYQQTSRTECTIRVHPGFACKDHRPEPDVMWLRPRRYGRTRPTADDVLLLVEVSESSLDDDLRLKSQIYSQGGIAEYWVIDIANRRVHVMSDIQQGRYCRVAVHTPPATVAPQCQPEPILNIAELFAVQ